MDIFLEIGRAVQQGVLSFAGLLKKPETPGLICLLIVLIFIIAVWMYLRALKAEISAIQWLDSIVGKKDKNFSDEIERLHAQVNKDAGQNKERETLALAWGKYRETLVHHQEDGRIVFRNSVRPSAFINLDDLGFGPKFSRIVPGLFVSTSLFLTFLGLVSALDSMSGGEGINQGTMTNLLSIASAKFTMSLTGLACSILFTVVMKYSANKIEKTTSALCSNIEENLSFISLEDLASEQLIATREQREHFRLIGMELVAELGRPLREELPQSIADSIRNAMNPLLGSLQQSGVENIDTMVRNLSAQFSEGVGSALTDASNSLAAAGDRISALSERMDQSSGRMGSEMDAAVGRLAQALDELREMMSAAASETSGSFTQGSEQLLGAINTTLESIRTSTENSTSAMTQAAQGMIDAAETIRINMSAAASETSGSFTQGSEQLLGAIKTTLESIRTSTENSTSAMTQAAQGMIDAAETIRINMTAAAEEAGNTAGRNIVDMGQRAGDALNVASANAINILIQNTGNALQSVTEFSDRVNRELLAPLGAIAQSLQSISSSIQNGTNDLDRMSERVKSGAEASERAAEAFNSASDDLVQAISPIRETTSQIQSSVRTLNDTTNNVAAVITKSSESIARNSAEALNAAVTILTQKSQAVETTMALISDVLERLTGQGARFDQMDVLLGSSFDLYTNQVGTAVDGMRTHISDMLNTLNPAIDTLREVVEQVVEFRPQSRRN